jgi:hypothetical protein
MASENLTDVYQTFSQPDKSEHTNIQTENNKNDSLATDLNNNDIILVDSVGRVIIF